MSYEIAKNLSIDFKNRTISICSASNNVTPRHYETWKIVAQGSQEKFDRVLDGVIEDIYGGSIQFQPSSECKAHEAYLKTRDEMDGVSGSYYADEDHAEFVKLWIEKFRENMAAPRDTRKFFIKRFGNYVNVSARPNRYGLWHGSACRTEKPKAVSWIKAHYLTDVFEHLEAEEV